MRRNNTILAETLYRSMVSEMRREEAECAAQYVFSSEFENKMKKLIKKQKKSYYPLICTAGRRAACIGTAALIVSGAAVSVEAVREKVTGFIVEHFQGYDVVRADPCLPEYIPEAIEQEYALDLPEGFVLYDETAVISSKSIKLDYMKNDKHISFRQDTLDNEYEGIVDTESMKKEYYTDENGIIYAIYCDENWLSVILWKYNGYLFRVVSNLEKERVLELCLNMKPVPSDGSRYPDTIEQEYSVDLPEGFVFDVNNHMRADNLICVRYKKGNDYIIFNQHTNAGFTEYIDNELRQHRIIAKQKSTHTMKSV